MRVMVLGATGLLGHATVGELLDAGHTVTALSRRPPRAAHPRLDECHEMHVDVEAIDDDELRDRLEGHDAIAYALGPDDRAGVPPPASAYFEARLVCTTERVFRAAASAGVGAAVLFGSYFTAWERHRPGFSARHPYAAARLRQSERAVAAGGVSASGGDGMRVSVLEIPCVFGAAPGVEVVWRRTVYDRVRRSRVVLWPDGATTTCTDRTVARAAVAAVERGEHGARYPVGDTDLEWNELLTIALAELGRTPPIVRAPRWLAEFAARRLGRSLARRGEASGIDPEQVMRDVMYARILTDHAHTRARLGIPRDDVLDASRRSVRASYPEARRRR